jgi:hypothetical protein
VQVAYIPVPVHPNATDNTTRRLDDYIAFIDDNVLLTADMLDEKREHLKVWAVFLTFGAHVPLSRIKCVAACMKR